MKMTRIDRKIEKFGFEELSEKEYDGEWETVIGVMTPGGDPWLRCPFCKAKNSEHLGGIEMPKKWRYCPNCGKKLWGDGYVPSKYNE